MTQQYVLMCEMCKRAAADLSVESTLSGLSAAGERVIEQSGVQRHVVAVCVACARETGQVCLNLQEEKEEDVGT